MCGIVIALSPRQPPTVATIVAMARMLRHRGPDDEGYVVLDGGRMLRLAGEDTPEGVMTMPTPSRPEGHVRDHAQRSSPLLMAHRRLSIVDLSPHGHQPMRRGEHLHVVFNGEIYNHVELRAELEGLGHSFESHSDTDVLLAAYAQWGEQAWARFNGMWAFAIHDAQRRKLVIVRDRFGVKPLYYWTGDGGELLLASEIKALLVHPRVQAKVDAVTLCPLRCSWPRGVGRDDAVRRRAALSGGPLGRGVARRKRGAEAPTILVGTRSRSPCIGGAFCAAHRRSAGRGVPRPA